MSTTTEIRPGATVRVTASYQSVAVGTTARVHREADHNGNLIIDHPSRGRMQYPEDSVELVAPARALPAERPSEVSELVNRHVERLKITTSGEAKDDSPARERVFAKTEPTADEARAIKQAAEDMAPVKAAWDAERDPDPNGIGHDPTSMAERRADDAEFSRVMKIGRAASASQDAIKAPESDETIEKAPTAKKTMSDAQRAAMSAGKARAKAERAAMAAIIEQNGTLGEVTELAAKTVRNHLRMALLELITAQAPASDLVAVARMIEQHEAEL